MRSLVRTLCTALVVLVAAAHARAQEQEPNGTCFNAQRAGSIAAPATFSANAGPVASGTDVDFLVFSATPGQALTVQAEGRDLLLVGSFDARCRLTTTGFQPVGIDVPATGRFVIGVAAQDDQEFMGQGSSNAVGPYTLRFGLQGPGIGSISVRALDSRSRAPLPTDVYPFALAVLERCEGDVCEQASARALEADGRVRIERDRTRRRIAPGTFRLVVLADDYEVATSERFDVAEGQHVDLGDIPVESPAIGLSGVRPCKNLPPQGGTCSYSVQLRNDTGRPLSGLARSLYSSIGSISPFEASTQPGDRGVRRARVSLAPSESMELAFSMPVPASAPEGAILCPFVEIGLDPAPLFDSARSARLFCIQKSGPGFRSMSAEEVQRMLEEQPEQPAGSPRSERAPTTE